MSLFLPLDKLGLSHRIVMAPLTRVRGNQTFAPGPSAFQYYTERASAGGLLITEGSPVCPQTAYEYAPGIYTEEQVQGWTKIVEGVHAKGGKIAIQLWHLGRMAHASMSDHPFLQAEHKKRSDKPLYTCVSASVTTAPGTTRDINGVRGTPYLPAQALTGEEIRGKLVSDFVLAATNAKRCGFDFVEIHSAHGYLFDQFFCDSTNLRTDEFGTQSIENRTRALGLVLEAVINVYGASRVGIRISPTYTDSFSYQGCKDSNPEQTYKSVIQWLGQFNLGYLLITEPRWNGGRGNFDIWSDNTFSQPTRGTWIKKIYPGVVIGSSSFTIEEAERAISEGIYDAIAFGRFFISTPDLPNRIKNGQTLNVYDTSTFYILDPVKGYVDYPPTYEEAIQVNYPQIASSQIGSKNKAKL